jgi:UDP-4-amino-4,6-dideoxy-N-acetyl-beta-L-altrosamine transaminase
MIPYGRQEITAQDEAAVLSVLRSEFLTQGPAVPAFEAAICKATNAHHAVAMNSATSALHVACLALGLGPGDLLWTSPITFVASANVGHLCGAEVDFVDIDAETFNMCPRALERKLAVAETAGRLPKIIMPVHMCGQSADMAAISALARKYGIRLIEDASHAIGGRLNGRPVGDCAFSDICVFSFHPVKIVTTAEGGAATTRDAGLAAAMARLRSHGITRDEGLMSHPSEGPWYYQQLELGLNYRMTDMQAALGASQMTRLAAYVARRASIADGYDAAFAEMDMRLPGRLPGALSSWHLYVMRVDALRRREIFETLRGDGIGVNVHYIPVHLQPYWRARGFAEGDFPAAEAYYRGAISLPLYAGMSQADEARVIDAVRRALA